MVEGTNPPILPPEEFPKAQVARAVSRVLAGAVPVLGSAISEAIDQFAPNPTARERTRWEIEVTRELNRLSEVSGRPQISRESFAWNLAVFANELDVAANGEVSIEDAMICSRFPDVSTADLEDAIHELDNADWISTWLDPNSRTGVGGFNTKALLFAYTDPIVRHTSPANDAKLAAQFILEQTSEDAVSAMMIEEEMNWDARRLCPALAFLCAEVFPPDSVETYYNPKYPFTWLYLNGNSRQSLRRFVRS